MVQAIERVVPRRLVDEAGLAASRSRELRARAPQPRGRRDDDSRADAVAPRARTNGQLGIVTEQDLSTRVLALGRDPRTPIGEIAGELSTGIPSDRTAADLLLSMLESGVRHVPVMDARRVSSAWSRTWTCWDSGGALRSNSGPASNPRRASRRSRRRAWICRGPS